MSVIPRSTTREAVLGLLPPLPKRWQLVTNEQQTAGDTVRVRVNLRNITHSDTGDASEHLATALIVVTVPTDTLGQAEDDLDDAMEQWLFLLDQTELNWTSADKNRFKDEDNRLGYSIEITNIRTTKSEED